MVIDPAFNPEMHPDNQLGIYPEKYPPASSSDESDEGDAESDENSVDNGTTLVLGDDIAPLADVPSDHEAENAGVDDGENLVTPPKRAATTDAVAAWL